MMFSRFASSLLVASCVPALLACDGCHGGCPDLAVPPLSIEVRNEAGQLSSLPKPVLFDVEQTDVAAGTEAFKRTDVDKNAVPSLPAGHYRFVFRSDGVTLGTLENVCTLGSLTGCRAEDAPKNASPRITLRTKDSGATVELTENGACPQ